MSANGWSHRDFSAWPAETLGFRAHYTPRSLDLRNRKLAPQAGGVPRLGRINQLGWPATGAGAQPLRGARRSSRSWIEALAMAVCPCRDNDGLALAAAHC